MSPFASVSAALHSMKPAPVMSRSFFTSSAEIAIEHSTVQKKAGRIPTGRMVQGSCSWFRVGTGNRSAELGTWLNAGGRSRGFGSDPAGAARATLVVCVILRSRRLGLSRFARASSRVHGIGDLRGEQSDCAKCIVVARNPEIYFVGVTVGVDDADDRNLQLAGFIDRNLFLAGVDDEDRVREARHAADALEVLLELASLFLEPRNLLLRQRVVPPVGDHRFQVSEPRQAALDRVEVGEEPAEPSLVDVIHSAAGRLFRNDVLRLSLGSDKQQRL